MPDISFSGHSLHFTDSDQAGGAARPVLLFLHAYTCNAALWDEMVGRFGNRFRCLALDLPGHGQSEPAEAARDMAYLAECAVAVLDSVGVARAHICGLSIGGMIAQHLGFSHAERVASLVLACTTGRLDPGAVGVWDERLAAVAAKGLWSQVQSTMERWYGQGVMDRFGPEDLDPIARMIATTTVEGAQTCGQAVKGHDVMDKLGDITAATLVLGGDLDLSFSPDHPKALKSAISDAQLVMLPNTGHLAPVQTPDAFAEALTAFYDQIGA